MILKVTLQTRHGQEEINNVTGIQITELNDGTNSNHLVFHYRGIFGIHTSNSYLLSSILGMHVIPMQETKYYVDKWENPNLRPKS